MQKKVSGLCRLYLPTYPLNKEIPSLESIARGQEKEFVNHVVLNHKGLNWKIYRYQLNAENYKSFFFAFIVVLKQIKPFCSTSWLVDSNARRLEKALHRNGIQLTNEEEKFLTTCKNFSKWKDTRMERELYLNSLLF